MKDDSKLEDLARGLLGDELNAEAQELKHDVAQDGAALGEDQALAGFRDVLGGRAVTSTAAPVNRPSNLRRLIYPLLAAAAALVIWLQNPGSNITVDQPAPDQTLGAGDTIECLAPAGSVDRFGPFTWQLKVPSEGLIIYSLQCFDLDQNLILEASIANGTQWTFTDQELALLPSQILWLVSATDATGLELAVGHGQASRP